MLADRYIRIDFTSQRNFENNFVLNIPDRFNFAYDIIDEYARLSPQKAAMIWTNPQGEERRFTFSDLSRLSNRTANFFKKLNLKKGDPVMLILKRRYEFWICYIALMKLGCVIIPASYQLAKKDIVYRCESAGVRAIVCVNDTEVLDHIDQARPECETLQHVITLGHREGCLDLTGAIAWESEAFSPPEVLPANDDTLLMYFTSGTTGMPKMAAHNYVYPLAQITTAAYWHNLNDDSLHMAVADSGWAKCGWGKMFGQWICGATLFIYDFDRFDAADMLSMLARYRVTSFCAPPTVYRYMIKEDLKAYDLSALEWANTAGEPLNPEVYHQFHAATGIKIHEGFGQSETAPLIMTSKWMEPRPGSTGKPSPLYDIALVDEEGQSVEDGVEGEIVIRLHKGHPAGLLTCYYRDDEQMAEVFRNGMYHTGDMAWRDVDGYYYFIGRKDDVIKSSGYRIGPFEVESALMEHPAVLECAVTAVPHPLRGQVVKATVVLAKGWEPSDELIKALQNHVKKATAPYKYPRIVAFTQALPKTVSGKIQRAKLRDL
ncbi:MAG: AMP-binding protein [Clostridia bacterium]|nr:AMP-binding protein [Clostridia bacterium]